jgi:hypothetical protein
MHNEATVRGVKWGFGSCQYRSIPFTNVAGGAIGSRRMRTLATVQILGLLAGCGGLLAGLFLLQREPLFGVLGILGAMSLILIAAAALCGTDVRTSNASERNPASETAMRKSSCIDH